MIACVRTPHPSLVAAWLTQPALRGQPLVLGGLAHERGSVIAASAEARALGVREGKSLNQAQQVAPDAVFQPVDEVATAQVRARLLAVLHGITSEVAAADEPGYAFLKLDGLALRWPDRTPLLQEIARRIESSIAVQPAIGVAETMFVSKVAADHAVAGSPVVVEAAYTRAYLAPLPIDVLPLEDDLREYLELLGLRTIGGVHTISRPAFRRQFGVKALEIYDLATGTDRRRLRPWRPPHRIEETQPLEPPVDDTQALQFIARALAERVSASLLAQGLGTRAIRVRLNQEAAPPIMRWPDNHRARRVAKKNTSVAVAPIDEAAQELCADDEHAARLAGLDELAGDAQSIKRTCASSRDIEGKGAGGAKLGLNDDRA